MHLRKYNVKRKGVSKHLFPSQHKRNDDRNQKYFRKKANIEAVQFKIRK